MVLIPLKSQWVSLIVTVISGASELALLWAALGCNTFLECRKLRNGGKLNVRNHRIRTKLLAVLATNAFIVLEIFNSFYSDPAIIERTEVQTCTSIRPLSEQQGVPGFSSRSNVISAQCLGTNTSRTWMTRGNLFDIDGEEVIQCSEDRIFEFDRGVIPPDEKLPRSGFGSSCAQGAPPSPEMFCSLVYQKGSTVIFTVPFFSEELIQEAIRNKTDIGVWRTDVNYNVTGMEEQIAQRVAHAFASGIFTEDGLRRFAFTGDGFGDCLFRNQIDATEVSLAFVCALVSVWALSFLIWIISIFLRRGNFFDMSDPLHWAQKTEIRHDVLGSANPVISNLSLQGEERIVVSQSTSSPNGRRWAFSVLRRIRAGARSNVGIGSEVGNDPTASREHASEVSNNPTASRQYDSVLVRL